MRERARAVGAIALLFLAGCGGASASMRPADAPEPPAPAAVPVAMPPPPPPAPGGGRAGDNDHDGIPDIEDQVTTTAAFERVVSGLKPQNGKTAPDKKPPPMAKVTLTSQPANTPPTPVAQAVQKQQPIIIYSAHLTMAVFEVENAMKGIEKLAKEEGGFLSKREDASITIRVPAERFEETVLNIEKIGDMLHRNVSTEDVTEEYRDLEVRLHAAKAVQQRLVELLSKAQKIEESLAIERELDRVTVDIDRIEGRLKFLRDRAAFSTISVTFQPKETESVAKTPFRLPTPWLSELGLSRLFSL